MNSEESPAEWVFAQIMLLVLRMLVTAWVIILWVGTFGSMALGLVALYSATYGEMRDVLPCVLFGVLGLVPLGLTKLHQRIHNAQFEMPEA